MVALLLLGALGVPLAEHGLRTLLRRRGHILGRLTLGGLSWQILSAGLWTGLAWRVGAPREASEDWNRSLVVLILGMGFVWVEGILDLLAPTRRPRPALLPREASGIERAAGAEAEERLTSQAQAESPPSTGDESSESSSLGSRAPAAPAAAEEDEPAELTPEEAALDPDAGARGEEEALSPEAEDLLARILSCQEIPVDMVMTPREEIVWIDANASAEEALAKMREAGHGRIVVAEGSLDRVLGMAHAKDLVPLVVEGGPRVRVRRHLRRWVRVPEGRPISGLLEDFRRHRVHAGIVVDALGRSRGLVTIRDVFRYLTGSEGEGQA